MSNHMGGTEIIAACTSSRSDCGIFGGFGGFGGFCVATRDANAPLSVGIVFDSNWTPAPGDTSFPKRGVSLCFCFFPLLSDELRDGFEPEVQFVIDTKVSLMKTPLKILETSAVA